MTTEQTFTCSPIAARWKEMPPVYEIAPVRNLISPQQVVSIVCGYLAVDQKRLFVRTRKREVVYARQLSMYFMRRFCKNMSLKMVGDFFIGLDHTTVIHSTQTITSLASCDEMVRQDVAAIDAAIGMPYDPPVPKALRPATIAKKIKAKPAVLAVVKPVRVKVVEKEPVPFVRHVGKYSNRTAMGN